MISISARATRLPFLLPGRSVAAACLAWLSLGAADAQAQAPGPDCVSLVDDAQRLACYDRAHGRSSPVSAPGSRPDAVPTGAPTRASASAASSPAAGHAAPTSPAGGVGLGPRWDLDGERGELFAPRVHRSVYLLPVTWTDRVNRRPSSPSPDHSVTEDLQLRPLEAKYQLSLKTKFSHSLLGTPVSLWGAYTQSSRWQVYNGAASRPFRETNYEPELIFALPLQGDVLGWKLRMASLSLNHQSNGRSLPLSRSWNRVIGALGVERGVWSMELRPWLRIRETTDSDDNPDVADYVGRGELRISRYGGDHGLVLQLRHSLRSGDRSRGSAQLEWAFPLSGALHGYLQVFGGHGESLVDYNLRQTKIGLGVAIAGWQ
jgi:phospholipase A1/A2